MAHPAPTIDGFAAVFDGWRPDDDPGASIHRGYAEQLEQIRHGNEHAFSELVLDLARQLEAYGRRFTGSADAARDLVQDVFAHLWTHRTTLQVRGSIRAYLYAAVRNRALDLRKHARIEERWSLAHHEERSIGMGAAATLPDEALRQDEIAVRVHGALDTLPPRAREAALLRWRDGLSRGEIAAIMGVAVPTVNNQLTLAARVVRELLADLRAP